MAAIFKFASCSLCGQDLYDGSSQCSAWLGSCGHRICSKCAPKTQKPLLCPPCDSKSTAFKSIPFSNATSIVELLSSCLSEAFGRIQTLEKSMKFQNRPFSPSPGPNLFSIPLQDTNNSSSHTISHPPPSLHYSHVDTTSNNLFALFPEVPQQDTRPAPSSSSSSRTGIPLNSSKVTISEAFNGPKTKKERVEMLDDFKVSDSPHRLSTSAVSSKMASKTDNADHNTASSMKRTQTKTKKDNFSQNASSRHMQVPNAEEKQLASDRGSRKAFLESLRAQYD